MKKEYFNNFFELTIFVENENSFCVNGVTYSELSDYVRTLKLYAENYSDYLTDKTLQLNKSDRIAYLSLVLKKLKTHSDSFNLLMDKFCFESNKVCIASPYASIKVEVQNKHDEKSYAIVTEIFIKVKAISLKIIFDIFYLMENTKPIPTTQTRDFENQKQYLKSKIIKISSESLEELWPIFKDHFSEDVLPELKHILSSGENSKVKFLFRGNSNRLTDVFKQLYENNLISGCEKKELVNWIADNFTFIQNNQVREFKYQTIEKTLCRNSYPCKKPLIKIHNGKIDRANQS